INVSGMLEELDKPKKQEPARLALSQVNKFDSDPMAFAAKRRQSRRHKSKLSSFYLKRHTDYPRGNNPRGFREAGSTRGDGGCGGGRGSLGGGEPKAGVGR